jgi:hypothetical protein
MMGCGRRRVALAARSFDLKLGATATITNRRTDVRYWPIADMSAHDP